MSDGIYLPNPVRSVVLGCSRNNVDQWVLRHDPHQQDLAHLHLRKNYPNQVVDAVDARSNDADAKRDLVICKMCVPDVNGDDGYLHAPVCTRRDNADVRA